MSPPSHCSLLPFLLVLLIPLAAREVMAFVVVPNSLPIRTRNQFKLTRAVAIGGGVQAPGGSRTTTLPPRHNIVNPSALRMVIDPTDAVHHAQAAADLLSGASDHATPSNLESALTSVTTAAAADVAVMGEKYAWEFLWWHGDKVNPLGEYVSVPPGNPLQNAHQPITRDYFLPENPKAAAEAIKLQQQATGAGDGPMVGIDPTQFRDALPGGKPEFFFDTPIDARVKQEPLTAADLEEIAHDGDILSRLPMVAFASVLIDFFFINSGRDVYRDEIDNDEEALRAEWVSMVVPRLGIGIVMALLTIASSYMFYHPI